MEAILKANVLPSAADALIHSQGFTEHTISLDVLEGVARMRYCLRVVAELLQLRGTEQGHTQYLYGSAAYHLLEETRYNHVPFLLCEYFSYFFEQVCLY